MTAKHRIFTTTVTNVYPFYVAKAEKKGRTQTEVDAIICSPHRGRANPDVLKRGDHSAADAATKVEGRRVFW